VLPVHRFDTERFGLVAGPPKTSAGDRRIPIPEWLCNDLAAVVAARRPDVSTEVIDRREYLFQTQYGNPINRDKLRQDVIRPALRAAGLPESFRTYDLRRSHASVRIDLGVNLLTLAQRMGRSDPAMTLRWYGHLFEGAQVQLSEKTGILLEMAADDFSARRGGGQALATALIEMATFVSGTRLCPCRGTVRSAHPGPAAALRCLHFKEGDVRVSAVGECSVV
jgi:Phage integrase family